jgi:hypothetical protein
LRGVVAAGDSVELEVARGVSAAEIGRRLRVRELRGRRGRRARAAVAGGVLARGAARRLDVELPVVLAAVLGAEVDCGRGPRRARAAGGRGFLREAVERVVLRARLADEERVLALGAADAHALLGNAGLVELKARVALLARDDHAQGSFVR